MSSQQASSEQIRPTVNIAPNNPVFDLPVLVAIEERLFEGRARRPHVSPL